tara:strand:+ start:152 stop:1015 length:864 start_codon:yes stop_codon:yes gene_type:complete
MILVFGLANFNDGYGFKKKKISLEKIKDIFKELKKNKIKCIDTAPSYYQPNKNYLKYIKNYKVYSKLKKIPSNIKNHKTLENFAINELKKDLKKHNISKIEGYYVHDIKDAIKYGKELYLVFKKLKRKRLIKHIGLSFYDIKNEIVVLKKFKPDIVQLPFNLLHFNDKYRNYIQYLKRNKIKVYVRSIYLQGMILKSWNKISSKFPSIKSKIKFLETKYGINSKRKKIYTTLNEIKKNENIKGIIFSVDNKKDLIDFLNIFKKKINFKLKLPQINNIDEKEIDPRKW